ncbi:hypothetical protein LOTGIDRAFT_234596 [Lottia gigantea]|uniref:Selenoprotein P N-terminal domain-containing protein n=1 Tax=Lottia gigantea TaxID=225164 RepID=V4A4R8_LOTGI|nr:hypothetical protein LOTGIDRAFT_234596 [Lottia gigantea]ESO88261.1 hypothetical protein LOTGIDRAFT_234596 [Lottia gigantea]
MAKNRKLQTLKNDLALENKPDVNFFIINGEHSQELIGRFPSIEIPIYQDTEQLGLWRTVFAGNKDDFIIFDRCGRRVYHIPLPYSDLRLNYTRYAIDVVYNRRVCGECDSSSNYMDRMMGDQPASTDVDEHVDIVGQSDTYRHRRRQRHGRHQDRDM